MYIIATETYSYTGMTNGISIQTFEEELNVIESISRYFPDDAIDKSVTNLKDFINELSNFDRAQYESDHEFDDNFSPSDLDLLLTINKNQKELFNSAGLW